MEQRNRDVDKQHTEENNPSLQEIQIPSQDGMQSNKPSGRDGMPTMVFAVQPATKSANQIRRAASGGKQVQNIPAEWVQNIYETNPAPPQKRRNISMKYLE